MFSLIPFPKLIKEANKFISKKKKFINYIGDNLFSNSSVRESLQKYKPIKKLKNPNKIISFIGLLSKQNLFEEIFDSTLEEAKAANIIYIQYNSNLKIRRSIIKVSKVKFKKKIKFKNLKKKRNKQQMHFNCQRKVRFNFSINENYLKKASIIFMFNFFNDKSWPATQGKVEVSNFKNNKEIILRNNLNHKLDVTAGVCLNDQVATGMQVQNIICEKTLRLTIISDDSILTVILNDHVQSADRWTNSDYAIQILKIILERVYNLFVLSLLYNTFQVFLDRSQHSLPFEVTPHLAGTCTDYMAQLEHVESPTPMCSTLKSKFRGGRDPAYRQLKPSASEIQHVRPPDLCWKMKATVPCA
jgi:hypothetical protein